ncbi:membrane-bound lytic murein transglycosylase B [Roseivirga pacifica]|uniref:Membrane-bound lytic murein transglycosylase B n=1 Tax=Roseivirga pacifica TaxID=1267423 RepID=A0A1I0RBM3_9BACT|nr:lytic murein transglycosylase B [Roseivirga pacifica]RKQ49335.1 membrane-bound lytic murein transglycosylase B [Roseivirga pacifica]SEW38060.1 membrane-bound lytic murein transglycosylase B [Roseivirga pacifica]
MRILTLTALLFLSFFTLSAQVDKTAVEAFITSFAKEHNKTEAEIRAILDGATYKQDIIDKISKPAEGTMTWERYRKIFMTDERIEAGVKFWNEHKEALEKISDDTGVAKEVIIGIIGVETYFGRIKGSYKVLDALYTLGFGYPKRGKFFRSELEKYLILAETEGLDINSVQGSYAGAMGYSQFMPSSYIAYAKSYDEGTANLIDSPEDAMASVANYIKVHRWQTGAPVTTKAIFKRDIGKLNKQVLRPKNSLSDYTAIDIVPEDQIEGNPKATLIILESGEEKEHWFGFYNFYVITRYNHSKMYAMAVHQLGQAIKAKVEAQ